jgi:kynureninase
VTIAQDIARRAAELDAGDPLARWRDEFVIAEPELAYLDGNSLGMAPRRTSERIQEVIREEWATALIASWRARWLDLPQVVGDQLAPLIGAEAGEVVVHDSTTVNLYQLVHAAVRLRPDRRVLAIDPNDFPTDRYVVAGIADALGYEIRDGFEDVSDVAVVVRSMIDYRTAEIADVRAETDRARDAGALVVWDLSHAAGVHPVGVGECSVDLAVGCTYKFLNGGPGSPGYSYVSAELIEQIDQPIHGWFATSDQFAMGPEFDPQPDIGRLRIGTPNILSLIGAQCGIELTAEAGIGAIRAKSVDLGRFGIEACDALGLATTTPRDDDRRGGHLCVHHPEAESIVDRLAREHRIVGDFREPDVIRLGCSPLTTRFADIARALAAIADLTTP